MGRRTDWMVKPISQAVIDAYIAEIEEYLRRWAEVDRLYPRRNARER